MSTARDTLHQYFDARHDLPADLSRSVGCVTPVAPLELVLAAGLSPHRLHGNPSRMPTKGDTYMEEEIDGEVRSLFDTFLRGEYAGFPLVLMSRGSEQYLQLYYYLGEVVKWEEVALPPIKIVDVMQTPNWMTGRYVRKRLEEIAATLGELGTPITPASLKEGIAQVNAMRQAQQDLNALRREGRVRGSDMLRMTALFGTIPVPDFVDLARALVAEAGPAETGPRIMLSGVAQDDPALYEALEAEGALVVADDHVQGERVFAHLVDTKADPLDALTEHYQLHAPGLRQTPQKRQDARYLATCREAQIDGDLCVLEDCDDTLGWDWPKRRQALEAVGVPSVLLTADNYFQPDTDARTKAIRDLLARVGEGVA